MKVLPFFLIVTLMLSLAVSQSEKPEKEAEKQLKPCLLVIDIQNEFLPYIPEREKEMGLQMINAAIQLFREQGYPIIRVYHTDLKWGPATDSEGFQFPESILIQDDDPMVIKNYPSSFKKTDLEKILREKECNTLLLCGLSAVGCVLATYFGGMDLDFNVFMVKNAVMSHNSDYTGYVQEIFDTVSYTAMKVMLECAAPEK